MEHYICRAVTELPGYMQVNFRVPKGEILASGQIYVGENLVDNYGYGNWTVFTPELIEDTQKQVPAIILNNDFEVLPDGRRPDGNPDYTQYVYTEGEVITAIKLIPGVKFELGMSSVIAETDIKVGGYLVPEAGSSMLMYSDNLEDINTNICLVIEALKDFRIGGIFGNETIKTMVVRVKDNCVAAPNGLRVSVDIEDNLEIPVEAQTVVATLSTAGGTEPYTYSFVSGGLDNDLFEIENQYIRTKNEIDVSKNYHVAIKSTDSEGNSKSMTVSIFIDNPSIKGFNVTMTQDIRQGEESTQPGGLIAVVEVEGGTAPYTLSLSGTDANKFKADLMSIKTGDNSLNQGVYNFIITATDSKEKTADYSIAVNVQEPYPDIESVTLTMEEDLTAPVLANTTVGHIQVLGGTPSYTITLPAGVKDNDLFIIEDAIKAKGDITTPGNKNITVKVTDIHGKTKYADGVLPIAAPEITAVNFSQTEGLREGETNVNPSAIVGTLSTTGGTSPFSYSISGGTNANLFRISGNTVRVKDTALTQGTYTLNVESNDNYGKSGNSEISITVEAAYEPVSEVKVAPVSGLTTPVAENTKIADISSTGGKPPVTYSLPAGINNNDSFKISGSTMLAKGEITQFGSYAVIVRATDANGNTKNSVNTAFTIAAGS